MGPLGGVLIWQPRLNRKSVSEMAETVPGRTTLWGGTWNQMTSCVLLCPPIPNQNAYQSGGGLTCLPPLQGCEVLG